MSICLLLPRAALGKDPASRKIEFCKLTRPTVRANMPRCEFGNLTSLQQKRLPLLENLWRDLMFAVRTLRRNPAFTTSCIATFAVGLGAMITVLCAVSALLWKPLPYPNPDRLVVIKEVDPRGDCGLSPSPVRFRRGVSRGPTFPRHNPRLTSSASSRSLAACFRVRKGGRIGPVWSKWQMNAAAIGQAVALDGENYTIAGVADLPADLLPGAQILLPLLPKATESRTAHEIEAVGRIRAGVDIGQAQSELNTIAASIARENPQSNAGWRMEIVRLSDYVIGPRTGHMVWMIFAAVALLWILACANVAGLQTARSVARRHEMGTRLALGASTRRLFAQTLVESAVLACAGFVLGFLIAQYAVAAIGNLAADSLPRLALHIDPRTMAIALGCMLVSTFLVTVFSGRRPELKGGREISRRDRGRDVLIVVQVALASTLLLATSLLLHSFFRLRTVDPGFDPERILTVHVNLPAPRYDSVRRVAFFRNAPERLTGARSGVGWRDQRGAIQRLGDGEPVPARRRGRVGGVPLSALEGCHSRFLQRSRYTAQTGTTVRRPGPRRFARGSDSQ